MKARGAQRLLVSVRGPREALEAAEGGAAIADVEYPASALGTPYPLNVRAVRERLNSKGHRRVLLSTNIGEEQSLRATACQAALGIATAGADLIKFGLAELSLDAAVYLGKTLVRTVRRWYPRKELYPAVFVDEDMQRFFNPLLEGPKLVEAIGANGLLLDTFNKSVGKGLLDFVKPAEVARLARALHRGGRALWVAGSITSEEFAQLWDTGLDVICVRGAACTPGKGSERFGVVRERIVRQLVSTMPRGRSVSRRTFSFQDARKRNLS